MSRKFRFLGYGDRQPCPPEFEHVYLSMPQDKYYWYHSPIFTVGKIYNAEYIDLDFADGFQPEGTFIDDEGDLVIQELQFFEEIFRMKTIKENKEIFGTLLTSHGTYELLSPQPNKHNVPWYFKDYNVLSFYVRDGYGMAMNILVGCPFLIEPVYEKTFKEVTFVVDEENPVLVETNTLTPVETD